MKPWIKLALQYIISLVLAVVLIYYALKDQDLNSFFDTLFKANPLYIVISTVFLTISHYSRALRWKILYKPLGYEPTTTNAFLALMSGYFMNQLIPRLGEVTRCGVLQKVEKIPLPISLGTVIAERLVDLIMLILLFVFTFFVEFERLSDFFYGIFNEKYESAPDFSFYFYILIAILAAAAITGVIVYQRFKEKIHNNKIFSKVLGLVENIIKGVISIRQISQWKAFVFHTLLIWTMYYGASFIVVYSLPETSGLSPIAGFTILLMGSLAMTAPVQGGIGAFELFVSKILILYGIAEKEGLAFAVLVHASQYLFTLLLGAICFLMTFNLAKRKTKIANEYSIENS